MTPRRAMALLALGWLTPACYLNGPERVRVQRWLLCGDCLAGELDSVVAMQNRSYAWWNVVAAIQNRRNREALVSFLERALEGPPQDRIANIQSQATASYAGIQHAASSLGALSGGPPLAEATYVNHLVGNYIATYQARAAIALARLPSSRAQRILKDALRRDSVYRPDVRRILGAALHVQVLKFAGDSQAVARDSTVPTPPTVTVRDSAGAPMRNVRVIFRADSGRGGVLDSVHLTNDQGLAGAMKWRVGSTVGVDTLRAIAAGRVILFRAFVY